MSEYVQISGAGNQNTQNVLRVVFSGADQSDIPQLQAWADFNLNTTNIEALQGTPVNGERSMLVAKSTHAGPSGVDWPVGLAQTPGGAVANRLRGNDAFVLLGTSAPVAPFPVARTFNMALLVPADASPGGVGFQPVVAVKVFYAGAPPTIEFECNEGSDGSPVWRPLTSSPQGVNMPIAANNGLLFTGPNTVPGTGSNNGSIDPITKPGSGEKVAEEVWVRSL